MPELDTYERARVPSTGRLFVRGVPLWVGVLVLALALTGSMALKIWSKVHVQVPEPDLWASVAPFLQRHGYRVAPAATQLASLKKVEAMAGLTCRLQVVEAQARGYNQDSIRQLAGPTDDFFVVFQGTVHDAQPVWQTKAYYYWDRLRREMGMAVVSRPVLAIIASSSCSARDLPWNDLAIV